MRQTQEQRSTFVDDAKGDDWRAYREERVLALDVSTHTGWAVISRRDGGEPQRVDSGTLHESKQAVSGEQLGEYAQPYPWSLVDRVMRYKNELAHLVARHGPDIVVIEETNLGQNRYDQKLLEWLHLMLLSNIYARSMQSGLPKLSNVKYLSTTAWRSALGIKLSDEDKKNNRKLSEIKKMTKDIKRRNELKKQFGITGLRTLKHVAVKYVNDRFKLDLLEGQNDEAEAICLGMAYFAGAKPCDGT